MTAARSSIDGAAVVAIARRWIGTPYHHQASLRGTGCDCLGLIRGVWRDLCGPEPEALPPYTADWGSVTGEETMLNVARRFLRTIPITDAAPGDVIVFRMRAGMIAKHCGILTEAGTFIHAQERVPVAEVALSPWWRRRIIAAFRFPFERDARQQEAAGASGSRNRRVRPSRIPFATDSGR